MPVVHTTRRIIEVKGNPLLARYVDLTKFLSLVDSQSLFFCRTDKLTDIFEGTNSAPTRQEMIDAIYDMDKYFFNVANPDQVRIEQQVDEIIGLSVKMKPFITVNCWQIFEEENALMWAAYTKGSEGIMIKSSFHRLIQAFGNPEKEILISQVGYVKPNQPIAFGNIFYPFLFKRSSYKDEREVRCLHEVSKNYNEPFDWQNQKNPNGVYIPVDLAILIDEIIISPFASQWYVDLVKSITKKIGLDLMVTKSKLS